MAAKTTNIGKDRKTSWNAREALETEMPDVQWLIQDILPRGFIFFGGRPKMRKSFLSLQKSISIVTGKPFLGHEVITSGRVLYISLEDNIRRLRKRMLNMGISTDEKGIELLEFEEKWPKLNQGGLVQLIKRLTSKKYVLCIMDTYAKSISLRDNNDSPEAVKLLEPLYELTRSGEFSFEFIDHYRKTNQFSGDVIEDLSGTGAKGGIADTIWGLVGERGKSNAKLLMSSRDADLSEGLEINFDMDRTLWCPVNQEIVKPGTVQAKILSYMGGNGKDAYLIDISKKLGYDYAFISREVNELIKKGVMYKGERQGKKVPYGLVKTRKLN